MPKNDISSFVKCMIAKIIPLRMHLGASKVVLKFGVKKKEKRKQGAHRPMGLTQFST